MKAHHLPLFEFDSFLTISAFRFTLHVIPFDIFMCIAFRSCIGLNVKEKKMEIFNSWLPKMVRKTETVVWEHHVLGMSYSFEKREFTLHSSGQQAPIFLKRWWHLVRAPSVLFNFLAIRCPDRVFHHGMIRFLHSFSAQKIERIAYFISAYFSIDAVIEPFSIESRPKCSHSLIAIERKWPKWIFAIVKLNFIEWDNFRISETVKILKKSVHPMYGLFDTTALYSFRLLLCSGINK